MGNIQPFQAVRKQFAMTELEASKIRSRLNIVRRQYIIELHAPVTDKEMLKVLQKEIDTLEHKLAHAEIYENAIDSYMTKTRQNTRRQRHIYSMGILSRMLARLSRQFHSLRQA